MEYEEGTLLWYWYENWVAVLGFVVALVLGVLVSSRSSWGTGGLLLKLLMVLAVVMTLPLTMIRLEINPQDQTNVVGYLSIAGVIVSLVVGLPYLIMPSRFAGIAARFAPGARREVEPEGIVTPEVGVPMAPEEDEEATAILEPEVGAGVVGTSVGGQPTAAWLVFKSGPRAGQSIPVDPGSTSIGRGSDNEIVVDDPSVSRRHATIAFQEGRYVVEDAGSSGGTIVEGDTSARTVLASGSTIQVGETELVFMQAEGAGAPPSTGAGLGAGGPGETMVMEQSAAVLAWLAVTGGPDKGKTYQLREGDTTIGREQGNDLVLADAGASRQHALIKHQEGKSLLLDLGSSGGTKVNGQAIGGRAMAPGGVISIGQTQLMMVEVEAQEAARAASMEGATMVAQPEAGGGVLIARTGPDAGKSFSLIQGDNIIGRELEGQIVLTDPAASRRHALVRRQGDVFMVYDLGSRSGTKVDGETVVGTNLSNGDVITIGRTEIVLMQPQQAER